MTEQFEQPYRERPRGITFLCIVNGVGFVLTLSFWATVFFRRLVPLPGDLTLISDRTNAAVTYGFMIADIVYSLPLLLTATIGLWRHTPWGWMAGQIVNMLWIYSMTVILFRDANSAITPGGVLFTPFALIAIWAIPYLWVKRKVFAITE